MFWMETRSLFYFLLAIVSLIFGVFLHFILPIQYGELIDQILAIFVAVLVVIIVRSARKRERTKIISATDGGLILAVRKGRFVAIVFLLIQAVGLLGIGSRFFNSDNGWANSDIFAASICCFLLAIIAASLYIFEKRLKKSSFR